MQMQDDKVYGEMRSISPAMSKTRYNNATVERVPRGVPQAASQEERVAELEIVPNKNSGRHRSGIRSITRQQMRIGFRDLFRASFAVGDKAADDSRGFKPPFCFVQQRCVQAFYTGIIRRRK